MTDVIKQPSHYTQGTIECIDYLRATLPKEQFKGFLRANAVKYLHRYEYKNGVQDLHKAQQYLDWLIKEMSNG